MQREGFRGQILIRLPESIKQQLADDEIEGSLYITDFGYYPPVSEHLVVRKEPPGEFIMILCVEGCGTIRYEETTEQVPAGSYIILPDNKPHTYGNAHNSSWSIYWVHFKGSLAARFAEALCNANYGSPQNLVVAQSVQALYRQIATDFVAKGISYELCCYANARLRHLFGDIIYHRRYTCDTDKAVVDKALAVMNEKIEENLSLTELADYVGLSPTYFSQLFKKRTNQSPIDCFIRLKLQRAADYLNFTDMRVLDVAAQVGYDDPYYFSRIFKRFTGLSPRDYRRKLDY